MSVIQSTTEKFEEIMTNVPSNAFHAPASMLESRQAKFKAPPLTEAKKKVEEKVEAKRKAKLESKKAMNEAAEKISDLYSLYVLEGVLDRAKDLNPDKAGKIESLKTALA